MDQKLFVQALVKFFLGAAVVGLLLFLTAGTLHYPGGLLFMAILFVPMFIAGLVMMAKNPDLLRKRLQAKEQESTQKHIIALSGLMFLAGFIAAGLSFRHGFLLLPKAVQIGGAVVFLLSYLLYAEVLRENTYLSRTIEVQENQKVIDTGLYGIVRHPMYMATLFLFLSMPLVLGSFLCFLIFLLYPLLIVRRIKNEEQVLEAGLEGYKTYKLRVKYRLFPYIW